MEDWGCAVAELSRHPPQRGEVPCLIHFAQGQAAMAGRLLPFGAQFYFASVLFGGKSHTRSVLARSLLERCLYGARAVSLTALGPCVGRQAVPERCGVWALGSGRRGLFSNFETEVREGAQ